MKIKYPELFEEFVQQGYDLIQLEKYIDFICECKEKDYTDMGINIHHILPRCMGGDNDKKNLIPLSYEDHYNAHIILANCFVRGEVEFLYNIGAGSLIIRNFKNILKKYRNIIISKEDLEFWSIANKYVNGALKGLKKTDEMRRNLAIAKTKPKILLKGVFYHFEFPIYDDKKKYYRICDCGEIMHYIILDYANAAEKKNVKCRCCRRRGKSTSLKGKTVGPRGYKVKQPNQKYYGEFNPNFGKYRTDEWKQNHSNLIKDKMNNPETKSKLKIPKKKGGESPNAKRVIDNRTGIEYSCVKEALEKMQLSHHALLYKLEKLGIVTILKTGYINGTS